MSLSVQFTKLLPVQHAIVTNCDDMGPDFEQQLQNETNGLSGGHGAACGKHSADSDAVLAKIDMLESKIQEEIASLRWDLSSRSPAIMVGMDHKDSYVSDGARSKCGVPLLAKMGATESVLHQEEMGVYVKQAFGIFDNANFDKLKQPSAAAHVSFNNRVDKTKTLLPSKSWERNKKGRLVRSTSKTQHGVLKLRLRKSCQLGRDTSPTASL